MGLGSTTDPGETRLPVLLAAMRPVLRPGAFVFVTLLDAEAVKLTDVALATFREDEGVSVVLPREEAERLGLRHDSVWALITLEVRSSLAAVGFLAAVLPALAAVNLSVNPVSAFHHDHLFVPWERREEALEILVRVSAEARGA